jgi:hypothetical protein
LSLGIRTSANASLQVVLPILFSSLLIHPLLAMPLLVYSLIAMLIHATPPPPHCLPFLRTTMPQQILFHYPHSLSIFLPPSSSVPVQPHFLSTSFPPHQCCGSGSLETGFYRGKTSRIRSTTFLMGFLGSGWS